MKVLQPNGSPEQTYARQKLAEAITAKGVPTDPKAPFNVMAENVYAIPQDFYQLEGSELYEKQMFGAATDMETPYSQPGSPLWNLYKIMADLKTDGRFVEYGGILLAEYYKGYDTIELMNVGAGGCYLTSDGNLYFTDKTGENAHVWHDAEDGKMNRWVAYIFAAPSSNYTIPSTNLCPRSIHIGREVGTIYNPYDGRIDNIVCTDGNSYLGTNFTSSNTWGDNVVLRGIKEHMSGTILNSSTVTFANIGIERCGYRCVVGQNSQLKYILFPNFTTYIGSNVWLVGGDNTSDFTGNPEIHVPNLKYIPETCSVLKIRNRNANIKLYLDSIEECYKNGIALCGSSISIVGLKYLYIGYSENDASKAIVVSWEAASYPIEDIELKQGFRKPLSIREGINLSREILREHIIDRLGDNAGNPPIRISLNSVNLASLEEEDIQVAINKNYTLA